MKKLTSMLLSAVLLTNTLPIFAAGGFTDVPADAWYVSYVERAVEEGLMNGYGNNQFGPANQLTRGEAAQIIYNWAGNPSVSGIAFPDTASMWFNDAAQFCKEKGFITGYENGTFGGGNPVTRQQLITILHRVFLRQEVSQLGGPYDPVQKYPDANQVADWAYDAMYWGIAYQLIGGSTYLNPNGNTTRADAAKMLVLFKERVGNYKPNPNIPSQPSQPSENYTQKVLSYLQNSGEWFWNGAVNGNASNIQTMVMLLTFDGNSVTFKTQSGDVTTTYQISNIQKNGAAYTGQITFDSLTFGGKTFAPAVASIKLELTSSQVAYDEWTMIQIIFNENELNQLTASNGFTSNGIVQFKDNRDLFSNGESNRPQM